MDVKNQTADQVVAGAVALGVVQVLTKSGMPSRVAPAASLIIAIIVVVVLSADKDARAVISGVLAGLAASGTYSGTKAVAGN